MVSVFQQNDFFLKSPSLAAVEDFQRAITLQITPSWELHYSFSLHPASHLKASFCPAAVGELLLSPMGDQSHAINPVSY